MYKTKYKFTDKEVQQAISKLKALKCSDIETIKNKNGFISNISFLDSRKFQFKNVWIGDILLQEYNTDFEKSDDLSVGKCKHCKKKLGYIQKGAKNRRGNKELFPRYFAREPFVFKDRKYYRVLCIDCFYKKHKRFPKNANILNDDMLELLEISRDEFIEAKKERFGITLAKMQEKYGVEEGNIKWEEYCKKQSYSNSLEYMVKKYGKIQGTKKYKNIAFAGKTYSKSSQKLFWEIYKMLSKEERKHVYFAELNKEIELKHPKGIYKLDFVYKDKVIEFNGEHCHVNPLLSNEEIQKWKSPYSSITGEERLNKEITRDIFIKNADYKVYTIWHKDYNKHKENVIKNALNFLLEK